MNRRTFSWLLASSTLPALACSRASTQNPESHSSEDLKKLSVDDVAARIALHDGKTFVFDNNSKERYAESHVQGARWLDFKHVTVADLPPDKNANLVFYCANSF
jgi:3-mercaptopyruvate sulfurtransferase SseA